MRRRWAVVLLVAVIALAAGWRLRTAWGAATARVTRGPLRLTVAVKGRLVARKNVVLSPPMVRGMYQFKIQRITSQGQTVHRGEPVLVFDGSELRRRLADATSEMDKAEKELEQRRAQEEKQRLDDELELAEARARLRKASLAAGVPEELEAGIELRKARMEEELARREVEVLARRIAARRRQAEAEVEILARVAERAAVRVRELQEAMAALAVRAPRDGIVVLHEDWRGTTPKAGDTTWAGRALAEIPELDSLEGDGEVPEALAGRIRVGQPARLSLDALPGVELSGTVRRISPSPTRRAWDDPAAVVHLRIALDSVDVEHMRPGMRFRGELVVETLPDVLQAPLAAVHEGVEGPEVTVWRGLGWKSSRVRTGRVAGGMVELLQGPSAGTRLRLEAEP